MENIQTYGPVITFFAGTIIPAIMAFGYFRRQTADIEKRIEHLENESKDLKQIPVLISELKNMKQLLETISKESRETRDSVMRIVGNCQNCK